MTEQHTSTYRLHWGHAIVISFVLWALMMAGFLYRATQEDTPLAATHSYEQGLQYEQSLARQRLAQQPTHRILLSVQQGNVVFTGPAAVQGMVRCLRPSNAALDSSMPFALDATGSFSIPRNTLASGPWTLQLHWQHQGQVLESIHTIVIP